MLNEALKPCPFCGGRAYIADSFNQYHIDCYHNKNCIAAPNTWLRHSGLSLSKQIKLHVDNIWHNLSKIFAYSGTVKNQRLINFSNFAPLSCSVIDSFLKRANISLNVMVSVADVA